MTVPFEQRVFPAMQADLPRKAQLVGYCPSSTMTSALVERLVLETEEAIGAIIWLTKAPLDFRNESHLSRHAALMNELADHAHPGTQVSQLSE
jgi:hypothetical protein